MVKYKQFKSISASSVLEDMDNFFNSVHYNNVYYRAVGSSNHLYTFYCEGKTGSINTHDYNISSLDIERTNGRTLCKLIYAHSKWWVVSAMAGTDTDPTYDDGFIVISVYDIETDTWYDRYIERDISLTNVDLYVLDIYSFGTNIDILWFQEGPVGTGNLGYATFNIITHTFTDNGSFHTEMFNDVDEYYPSGKIYDSKYYLLFKNNSGTVRRMYWDSSYSETAEDYSVSTTSSNPSQHLYWLEDGLEIILDTNLFQLRETGGSWITIAEGSNSCGIIWAIVSNELVIKDIIYKNAIYQKHQKTFLKIQELTTHAFVGWDDWFSNGINTVYQITYEELTKLRNFLFFSKLYTPTYAELICEIEPF
ncbi:MAG: hypothetical protein ACTSX4_11985, partial [Candidatus Helarchaeota archaeon]